MTRKSHLHSIAALLSAMLLTCTIAHQAVGQSTPAQQQQSSSGLSQPASLSLPHLYWHFLIYQNHLDREAAAQAAIGKDGSWLRNHFQQKLEYSDADFAAIRTSSARLTAEVNALNAQAAAIMAAGHSSTSIAQLKALTATREADINAEVAYLRQTLSPEKIAKFEALLVQLFSTKNVVLKPNPSSGQSTPTAVQ